MKLINSSYKIVEQQPGINGIYQAIEYAGRICYKSSDKITDTSAKEFVDRMINSGHGAMLELGTVYLKIRGNEPKGSDIFDRYHHNIYSKTMIYDNCLYISSNYRVLIENEWLDDLKYLCEPTEFHEKRICVRFNCSIGISRELNRHKQLCVA